jgi:hypothetical protein
VKYKGLGGGVGGDGVNPNEKPTSPALVLSVVIRDDSGQSTSAFERLGPICIKVHAYKRCTPKVCASQACIS